MACKAAVLTAQLLWTLAALLTMLLGSGSCQQVSPLQGRGFPPHDGLDVYVTLLIDRILNIDDTKYRFEAMLYFQLSWHDARAQPAYLNATAAAASDPGYNNGNGCQFPCSSLYQWTPGAACCDGVFLPNLEFVNARGFSQDRPLRWRVAVNTEPGSEAVVWYSYVLGEFYTPMQFHAFPFDEQKLLVQMQYGNLNTSAPLRFIPSSTGTKLYHPRTGDDLDGWNIKAVEIVPYNFSEHADYLIRSSGATYSAPGDPWPLNPANKSVEPFTSQLWNEGVNIVITVGRISTYYIIVAILPIAVNVWLCLLVFFISPRHLDTRLGVVVTMFLSLTAIQFVISSVLPSSSTVVPTQQLIIVSYAVLALIGIMSIVVYFVITADRQCAKRERSRRASRAFTHRWTTFVGGVGSASAAGVEAAAAAAVARSDTRPPPAPVPGSHRSLPDGGNGGADAGIGAAAAAGGAVGVPAAAGGASLQLRRRARGGAQNGSEPPRFTGVGLCASAPDGQGAASDDSDDDKGDNKSYVATDSEAESEPPFREKTDGRGRGVWWGGGPLDGDSDPPGSGNAAAAGGGWDGGGSGGSVLAPDRGEGGDMEAGRPRVQQQQAAGGQQAQQQQSVEGLGGASLEGAGSSSRGRGCCARRACCGWPWWREALGRPWSWLKLQQLRFKEMMREAERNKEYAEHLARSLDRVVFWVVLLGYNLAVVIIFAVGAQGEPTYAFG